MTLLETTINRRKRGNADFKTAFNARQRMVMNLGSGVMGMATGSFFVLALELSSRLSHLQGPRKSFVLIVCFICIAGSAVSAWVFFYMLRETYAVTKIRAQERSEALAARRLQESFQPRLPPKLSGIEVASTCRMCREVGGDLPTSSKYSMS